MEPAHLSVVASNGAARSDTGSFRSRRRLKDILRAHDLLNESDIAAAQAASDAQNVRLSDVLYAHGLLEPDGLASALQRQWGLQRIDLGHTPADPRLVVKLGPLVCLRHNAIPWRRIGAATVVVVEDPEDFERHRETYEARLGPVMLALTGRGDVAKAIANAFPYALVQRAETRVAEPLSSRSWRAEPFRLGATFAAMVCFVLSLAALPQLFTGLLMISLISLVFVSGLKIAATIAQARPGRNSAVIYTLSSPPGAGAELPCISVLVPLYHEQHIAGHLIRRLDRLEYPRALLDVCLVVEADDAVTHATLAQTVLPPWMRVITVPKGSVKTKPRAMNYALDFCRGSIIGVYDAEDAPAPDQLRKVAERFAQAGPNVACLQGALDFYNTRHNWMSRLFTLEYAAWFRIMLPGIARMGLVVPLGGTTLFFKRDLLEDLGAWDAHNVTEDADLGVRLARAGFHTEIIETVTEEEACSHPVSWVKQRSRWLKGFAMTYAVHMRTPRKLWQDLGAKRFFGFQTMFLGTLLQFALAPIMWSMWLIPLGLPHPVLSVLPMPVIWVFGILFATSKLINLAMTTRAMQRTERLGLIYLALTQPPYFALASFAMYKALFEMFHKPFYWDKTQHGQFGGSNDLHDPRIQAV